MPAFPTPLRRSLLAGLCGAALVMGACGGGDKTVAEEITVATDSLGLSGADESELSAHFAIAPRAGDADATSALLATLDIGEDNYATQDLNGATAVYSDWTATTDDNTISAETVRLVGLHEADDGPTADLMVLDGVRLNGFEMRDGERVEVVDATIAELSIVSPSPALFADLLDVMMARDESNVGDEAIRELTDAQSFRAMRIGDLRADVSEDGRDGTLSIKQVVIGNDAAQARVDAVIEQVGFDWVPSGGDGDAALTEAFSLKMDGLTVMGLDSSEDALPGAGQTGMIGLFGALASQTTTGLPYEQVDMGPMTLRSAAVDLDMEGFEADSAVSGDVTTLRSVMSPMTVSLKEAPALPWMPYLDAMRENGLDVLSLKGSQTTRFDRGADRITVENGQLEIDEGLRLNCGYGLTGTQAAQAYIKERGQAMPNFEDYMTEGEEPDMEAFFAAMEQWQAVQNEANALIRIDGLDCIVQDLTGNSLVDRGYAMASAVTGKPVAVLKGSAKTMIALGSLTAQTQAQRDLLENVGSGLIDFLDTPGQTMRITMTPEEPVSLSELATSPDEDAIAKLGLKVEVN